MKRRAPSQNLPPAPFPAAVSLSKYHYRYLGSLERDLDSFDREAGLPAEVVQVLSQLFLLAQRPQSFLQSRLLGDIVEFLLKIPEGLIPTFYSARICTSQLDRSIRGHLKTLPLENYCALKCLALFFKSISFSSPVLVPFDAIENETGICEAITPAPRDDRFKPILIKIFTEPADFFPVRSNKKINRFFF